MDNGPQTPNQQIPYQDFPPPIERNPRNLRILVQHNQFNEVNFQAMKNPQDTPPRNMVYNGNLVKRQLNFNI